MVQQRLALISTIQNNRIKVKRMKKLPILFATVLILLSFSPLFAQKNLSEKEIKRLYRDFDLYKMNQIVTNWGKYSISTLDSLKLEAITGVYFNRYNNTISAVDRLQKEYSGDLSESEKRRYINAKVKALDLNKNYSEAIKYLYDNIEEDEIISWSPFIKFYKAMEKSPSIKVIKPPKDVEVPIIIERIGKGMMMNVKTTINGKDVLALFDTGWTRHCGVSKSEAEKLKMESIYDDITLLGSLSR